MIGCLGGLGRSRRFLFLGRSGLKRSIAREFVDDLQIRGAEVNVVQEDVGIASDVEQAVNQINGPIGGVIQAAMGLNII